MWLFCPQACPAHVAPQTVGRAEGEDVLPSPLERPAHELGHGLHGSLIDLFDDVAQTEAGPIGCALLPYQTYLRTSLSVGHESYLRLSVANDNDGLLSISIGCRSRGLEDELAVAGKEGDSTVLQQRGSEVGATLCGEGMHIGKDATAQLQVVEMEEDDLAHRLYAVVPHSMSAHGASFYDGIGNFSPCRPIIHPAEALVEGCLVHGEELSAACVEEHSLLMSCERQDVYIGHVEIQVVSQSDSLGNLLSREVEMVLAVGEDELAFRHVDLHRQAAIDEVKAQDTIDGGGQEAGLHGGSHACDEQTAQLYGGQHYHRHGVGTSCGVV